MSKFKITDMKCFKQVANVIGIKNAERELFIASQSKNSAFEDFDYLNGAFYWYNTKQGDEFWRAISNGVNPYEQ